MSNEPRFYAVCLADYTNGNVHGKWIEATTDVEEMQEQINALLRTSKYPNVTVEHEGKQVPSAEEWAVHASEDLPQSFGEYPTLQQIAEYMEFVEECEKRGLEDIVEQMFDYDIKPDDYAGESESEADFTEEFLNNTGFFSELKDGSDSKFAQYFDFERYWRSELQFSMHTINYAGTIYFFFYN